MQTSGDTRLSEETVRSNLYLEALAHRERLHQSRDLISRTATLIEISTIAIRSIRQNVTRTNELIVSSCQETVPGEPGPAFGWFKGYPE